MRPKPRYEQLTKDERETQKLALAAKKATKGLSCKEGGLWDFLRKHPVSGPNRL